MVTAKSKKSILIKCHVSELFISLKETENLKTEGMVSQCQEKMFQ